MKYTDIPELIHGKQVADHVKSLTDGELLAEAAKIIRRAMEADDTLAAPERNGLWHVARRCDDMAHEASEQGHWRPIELHMTEYTDTSTGRQATWDHRIALYLDRSVLTVPHPARSGVSFDLTLRSVKR